jgi:hypothetical protein
MSKSIEDPLFYSTKDLTKYWGDFIDDVFGMFNGNMKQAELYFDKLNNLHQGHLCVFLHF